MNMHFTFVASHSFKIGIPQLKPVRSRCCQSNGSTDQRDDGESATEFSVTAGSGFEGWVGLRVSVVECLHESVSISIRQTSDLDILEYSSSFSNDGRDRELRDCLAQNRGGVLNDLFEFARKSDIDPCIIPGDGHEVGPPCLECLYGE